jgi:hypothetical protein
MEQCQGFTRTESSFQDRAGPPDELSAAVGHVVFAFSSLSARLDSEIVKLLGGDPQAAELVLRTIPFQSKVNAMGALVSHLSEHRRFNNGAAPLADVLVNLMSLCDEAEVRRGQMVEAAWEGLPYLVPTGTRRRVTRSGAEADDVDAAHAKDVADFIIGVEMHVQEFFLEPINLATAPATSAASRKENHHG